MEAPFDIFRSESDGNILWRGATTTLDEAKKRVQEFAKSSPAEYIIINLQTGLKVTISQDGRSRAGSRTDETPQIQPEG
jgi:hypothetical protein